MKSEAAEAIVATVATRATYGGTGVSVIGWMLSSQGAVAIGIVISIAGFLVNTYYKRRADARHAALTEARLRRINAGKHSDTDLTGLEEE